MAKSPASYYVYCYLCGHRFEVGRRTMTTSCPACFRAVLIEDVVINNYQGVMNVETCGKLIVKKNGNVIATKRVVAYGGIEVMGRLQCGHALTAGLACIKPRAEWKGDLDAPSVDIQEGAKIHGGRFRIPVDPLAEYRHQEDQTKSSKAGSKQTTKEKTTKKTAVTIQPRKRPKSAGS